MSDTIAKAVKPDLRCSWKGHSGRVGASVRGKSTESHCVVQTLCIPSVIHAECHTSVVVS